MIAVVNVQMGSNTPMAGPASRGAYSEIIGLADIEFHRTGYEPAAYPNTKAARSGFGPPNARCGTGMFAGQVRTLPVISYSSLTLRVVFGHFRSYQLTARFSRNAAANFCSGYPRALRLRCRPPTRAVESASSGK
jgi:hypothetical protein